MGPSATTLMMRRSSVPCGRSKRSSVFIPVASTYTPGYVEGQGVPQKPGCGAGLNYNSHSIGRIGIPAQHAEGAEGVPAAWLSDRLVERERKGFVVCAIKRPRAVGQAFFFNDLDGVMHARVRGDVGSAEIVERAQNVIAIARRERELEEFGTDHFARGKAPEKCSIEKVLLGAAAGSCDLRRDRARGPASALEFQHAFEDADG